MNERNRPSSSSLNLWTCFGGTYRTNTMTSWRRNGRLCYRSKQSPLTVSLWRPPSPKRGPKYHSKKGDRRHSESTTCPVSHFEWGSFKTTVKTSVKWALNISMRKKEGRYTTQVVVGGAHRRSCDKPCKVTLLRTDGTNRWPWDHTQKDERWREDV